MKRLERNNPGIDYVRLLAEFSKRTGIKEYSEHAFRAFGDETAREAAAVLTTESRLSGIRAQAVFMAVVAGIGKVRLIRSEDEGDLYYTGDDVQTPDFRIILQDGTALLVEVKAPTMKDIHDQVKLGDTYIQQLRRYADMTKTDLRLAVYWDGLQTWTLNPLEAFEAGAHGEKQWTIDFPRAYETSEMAILGDMLIATHAPLRFRLHADRAKSDRVPGSDGSTSIIVDHVELLSRDRPLRGRAAGIAWQLVWHGTWVDAAQEVERDGNRVLWVDHLFGPTEDQEEWANGCSMIGSLSRIITSAYLSGAERTVHTNSKSGVLEPGVMGQFIPDDFMTTLDLPLALIEVQSNLEHAADTPG